MRTPYQQPMARGPDPAQRLFRYGLQAKNVFYTFKGSRKNQVIVCDRNHILFL